MKIRTRTRLASSSRALLLAIGLCAALTGEARAARAVAVRTSVAYRPRPVARTAAVVGTAVVVGSVVRSLPPSCSATVVGSVTYEQCGGTWYRPAYAGSEVTYTVVTPPR